MSTEIKVHKEMIKVYVKQSDFPIYLPKELSEKVFKAMHKSDPIKIAEGHIIRGWDIQRAIPHQLDLLEDYVQQVVDRVERERLIEIIEERKFKRQRTSSIDHLRSIYDKRLSAGAWQTQKLIHHDDKSDDT